MRKAPVVGTKLWFVPRDDGLGWGWRSASWEGHVTIAVTVGLAVGAAFLVHGALGGVLVGSAVAALLLTCVLKGTAPGGRKRAEALGTARPRR